MFLNYLVNQKMLIHFWETREVAQWIKHSLIKDWNSRFPEPTQKLGGHRGPPVTQELSTWKQNPSQSARDLVSVNREELLRGAERQPDLHMSLKYTYYLPTKKILTFISCFTILLFTWFHKTDWKYIVDSTHVKDNVSKVLNQKV